MIKEDTKGDSVGGLPECECDSRSPYGEMSFHRKSLEDSEDCLKIFDHSCSGDRGSEESKESDDTAVPG